MDRLEEIRQKLLAGQEAKELVKAGYARTSVYAEAKKLRSRVPASVPDDELADLRKRRDILKLGKEIADIEASKEKLPDRVVALEREDVALRKFIHLLVNNALVFAMKLNSNEVSPGDAKWCTDFVAQVRAGL